MLHPGNKRKADRPYIRIREALTSERWWLWSANHDLLMMSSTFAEHLDEAVAATRGNTDLLVLESHPREKKGWIAVTVTTSKRLLLMHGCDFISKDRLRAVTIGMLEDSFCINSVIPAA